MGGGKYKSLSTDAQHSLIAYDLIEYVNVNNGIL